MSVKEQEVHLAQLEEWRMRLRGNTGIEGRINAIEEVLQGMIDQFIEFTKEDIAMGG